MSIRWLALANLALGCAMAAIVFIAPPRSIVPTCMGAAPCVVTQLDRIQCALLPLLAFELFVGGALLLSKVTRLGGRVLLMFPWVVGLACFVGLSGAAILAGLQA